MNHGSLFTGLGMFDYAAELAGIKTIWQVEINEFCQKLLSKRFPDAKRYRDIKQLTGDELETVNIISGGFPCQPFSQAGKRKGNKDDRNLFPEMLRIVRKKKPGWILAENVYGILTWDDGKLFEEEIVTPLEDEGYAVQSYIIPASAVNAIHKRDRLWIIANKSKQGLQKSKKNKFKISLSEIKRNNLQFNSNSKTKRLERTISKRNPFPRGCNPKYFDVDWPEAAALLCRVDASFTSGLVKPGYRKQRLEALGNGIQWEIAYIFFTLMKQMSNDIH